MFVSTAPQCRDKYRHSISPRSWH